MPKKELQPSELKVMQVVWSNAPIRASEIVAQLVSETGWSKNTIYTLITRAVNKGFIQRTDPGFICTPLVSREEIQRHENQTLLNRLYNGSAKQLFARMMGDHTFSKEDLTDIRAMLDQEEKKNHDS
ncbi:MAG: BlaI/MecI/CopY family transcriptional regulator [Butyricicoccus sp.]|nr:BlaI/MecI/CopY family transcriptional regulator [Butyricicoccus sp.]